MAAPKEKVLAELKAKVITNPDAALKADLALAIEECYERLLGPALDNDLRLELNRNAQVKRGGVGADGKALACSTLQPNKDEDEKKKTAEELVKLMKEHGAAAV